MKRQARRLLATVPMLVGGVAAAHTVTVTQQQQQQQTSTATSSTTVGPVTASGGVSRSSVNFSPVNTVGGSDRVIVPVNGLAGQLPVAQIFQQLDVGPNAKSAALWEAFAQICKNERMAGDQSSDALKPRDELMYDDLVRVIFVPHRNFVAARTYEHGIGKAPVVFVKELPSRQYVCLGSILAFADEDGRPDSVSYDMLSNAASDFVLGLNGFNTVYLVTDESSFTGERGVNVNGLSGTISPSGTGAFGSGVVGGIISATLANSYTWPHTKTGMVFVVLAEVAKGTPGSVRIEPRLITVPAAGMSSGERSVPNNGADASFGAGIVR